MVRLHYFGQDIQGGPLCVDDAVTGAVWPGTYEYAEATKDVGGHSSLSQDLLPHYKVTSDSGRACCSRADSPALKLANWGADCGSCSTEFRLRYEATTVQVTQVTVDC